MNNDFKTKLVAALRSGKYVQDAGEHRNLRTKTPNGDCYCVMGVVADVFDPNGWHSPRLGGLVYSFGDGNMAALDPGILEAIGMTDDEQWLDFIYPNDRGTTFAQFADRIEQPA